MRKPDFCLCENKGADQLRGNREADQRLCFRYTDSTLSLLIKSEISSFYAASGTVHVGLCQTWLETPKTGFLALRLIWVNILVLIFQHLFREPEKHPPKAVSTAFSILVLVPLVVLAFLVSVILRIMRILLIQIKWFQSIFEARLEKHGLQGFRPGPT